MEHNRESRVEPEYTMQAVVSRTGVPADTIRSWERRHGFPRPGRDGTNHRVYSDADIQAILQLTALKDGGLTMTQAIARIRDRDRVEPSIDGPRKLAIPSRIGPSLSAAAGGIDSSVEALAAHLDAFDGGSARRLLDERLAVRSVDDLLFSLFLPLLRSPGTGGVSNAFRDGFVRQVLYGLYNASAPDVGEATIVLLGVPGTASESHLLLHAIWLSRAGYRTIFLGVDVALHHAESAVARILPHAMLILADTEGSAWTLARWCDRLDRDRPVEGWNGVLLGAGSIFQSNLNLTNAVPATSLPDDPVTARAIIDHALHGAAPTPHVWRGG